MDAFSNCSDCADLSPCAGSRAGTFFLFAWFVSYWLLLPLFLSVLYLGCRRRTKRRPRSAASHSDVFTFHMIAEELLTELGSVLLLCGIFAREAAAIKIGSLLGTLAGNGQIFFHSLTCVDRYLAVVHPITYIHLKKRTAVRNVVIGIVWVLSVGNLLYVLCSRQLQNFVHLSLTFLSLALTSFCSFSVLRVLIRPNPGGVGGARNRRSKKSAFVTITVIQVALTLGLLNGMVVQIVSFFVAIDSCLFTTSALWFSFPCSLVLPLLYLHKTRTRRCS